jgi:hypothetical protein
MGTELDFLVIENVMIAKTEQDQALARQYTSAYALD